MEAGIPLPTAKEPLKEEVYFSIDIENGGCSLDDPLLAIGICLGSHDGKILDKKTFCCPAPDSAKFNQRCWQEFWKTRQALLLQINETARQLGCASEKEMIYSFCLYLNDLERSYSNIVVISDNPAFDLGYLDHRLHLWCKRPPIRYTSDGKYRCVTDPSCRMEMLPDKHLAKVMKGINAVVQHDHWPENDAHFNYLLFLESEKIRLALNK